jgi:hypothetical protein
LSILVTTLRLESAPYLQVGISASNAGWVCLRSHSDKRHKHFTAPPPSPLPRDVHCKNIAVLTLLPERYDQSDEA